METLRFPYRVGRDESLNRDSWRPESVRYKEETGQHVSFLSFLQISPLCYWVDLLGAELI